MLYNMDIGVIINQAQVASIKIQACLDACNLQLMINSLDSRMSNLDYTLGLMTNVVSQIGSGI